MSRFRQNAVAQADSPQLFELLRRKIAALEGGRKARTPEFTSTGLPALDQLLPQGGVPRGALVEWLAAEAGSGATELALRAAREACREGGIAVIFDPRREFYPPAAARAGLELARLIVVQPASAGELLWAVTQTLRCPAVAATLVWLERLEDGDFRRLQLAAEEGESVGLLVRPGAVQHCPSWAEVRLLVEPLATLDPLDGRRWRVTLLRCRGSGNAPSVEVRLDHETHLMPQAFVERRHVAGA